MAKINKNAKKMPKNTLRCGQNFGIIYNGGVKGKARAI